MLTIQILSDAERQRIHARSLDILEKSGVRFPGTKALHLLDEAGAFIDWDRQVARLPEKLVEQALQLAPKSFTLGARNPAYNYAVPSQAARYCIDGTAAFAVDFWDGERRYGTRKDNQDGLRVFQQADLGVMAWAPTTASDAPSASRALHEFFTMMKYSSKHGEHELHSVEQVPYLVAGLKVVLGSETDIRLRRNYSLIFCPVAPLSHDGAMLDAYLLLGEYDLPVTVMPMPVSGSTGPGSLFANTCLANAEFLASLVIFQVAHPGRPVLYGNATGTLDFSSGAFLGGSPEMGLMAGAAVEMGKFYGLPTVTAGMTSDANQPGPQAVIEKLITTLPPALAGADIIVGYGEIESDQALVLEQILVDNEIAHLCQRLCEGISAAPTADLLEDILQVGPGGHFLKQRSTRQAARSSEFYLPKLIDRHPYESWLGLGKPDLYSQAREQVSAILSAELVDPLPEKVIQELDQILNIADKELTNANNTTQ